MQYDLAIIEVTLLIAMAKLIGYADAIAQPNPRWQLYSLTAVMGCPATHAESVVAAGRMASELANTKMVLGDTARLHYGKATGGVAGAFRTTYHPNNFGNRTRKGSDWRLVCLQHATSYDDCKAACKVGVTYKGQYLIDIVRELPTFAPTSKGASVETLTPVQQQLLALRDAQKASIRKANSEVTIAEQALKRAENDLSDANMFADTYGDTDADAVKAVISEAKAAVKAAKATLKQSKADAKAIGKGETPAPTTPTVRRGRTPSPKPDVPTPRQASASVTKAQKAVNALSSESDSDAFSTAYKLASDGLRTSQASKHAKSIQRANDVLAKYADATKAARESESIDSEHAAEADAKRDMAAVEVTA